MLIDIYGTNKDTPEFYEIIKNDIITYGNNIILAGDFNLVLDSEIETLNYKNINNPKARETVYDCKDFDANKTVRHAPLTFIFIILVANGVNDMANMAML